MFKQWLAVLAVAMGLFLAGATPAHAQQLFNFSYAFSNGDILSGVYSGSLAPDNNTFTVTNAVSYSYNGTPFSLGSSPDSYSNYYGVFNPPTGYTGTGVAPVVTLDASYLNIIDFDGSTGFILVRNVTEIPLGDAVSLGGLGSNGTHPFLLSDWSASVGPAVAGAPEPATWAMMILGFGIAGAALRRQRRPASETRLAIA